MDIEPTLLPALHPARVPIPLFASKVVAGFPSPADDYIEARLDLNELLIAQKEATFFWRVQGFSMVTFGIDDGDLLVVNRSKRATHGSIVVAVVDGELTVKKLHRRGGIVKLCAGNKDFPDIEFRDGAELVVWGVVGHVIHAL